MGSTVRGCRRNYVMIHMQRSMKISVKLPVMVRVDNVGSTFMSSYITTSCHTKHMDMMNNYVNEYMNDGVVKIFFAKSTENGSTILPKN